MKKILNPDGSRDPRIEDPTNLWIIHPSGRFLLPFTVKRGISANLVSIAGLVLGGLAALAYGDWTDWRFATIGFLLCIGWLIADGLDGMVARATGTSSAFGRFLDGLCDHGVFGCIYVSLALSIGTVEAWITGWVAAFAHALQSNLYEAERHRYHRRIRGEAAPVEPPAANALVRLYDRVSNVMESLAAPFDLALAKSANKEAAQSLYGDAAARPMRFLALLSGNVRVLAIYVACMLGDPILYWRFEIIALSLVAFVGILWHRRVERVLMGRIITGSGH